MRLETQLRGGAERRSEPTEERDQCAPAVDEGGGRGRWSMPKRAEHAMKPGAAASASLIAHPVQEGVKASRTPARRPRSSWASGTVEFRRGDGNGQGEAFAGSEKPRRRSGGENQRTREGRTTVGAAGRAPPQSPEAGRTGLRECAPVARRRAAVVAGTSSIYSREARASARCGALTTAPMMRLLTRGRAERGRAYRLGVS